MRFCLRLCVLLIGFAGFCGAGAFIESFDPAGLVLAVSAAVLCRAMVKLLPEGRRDAWL